MATLVDRPDGTAPSKRSERRFFTGYALGLILLAFMGFARSFYLRSALASFGPAPPVTSLLLAHGIASSAFLLLYPLQTWLISAGKVRLHKQLGRWGLGLGLALVPLMYLAARETYHAGPATASRALAVVAPFSLMPIFAALLGLAWLKRLDSPAHKRLIIIAGCILVAPAVARIPLPSLFPPSGRLLFFVVGMQLLMLATVLPLWIWDRRVLGRLHWATKLGSGLFALAIVARTVIGPTAAWASIVGALPGFGPP